MWLPEKIFNCLRVDNIIFSSVLQDTVMGQLSTVRAIHTEWRVGGMSRSLGGFFFCKCFAFFSNICGQSFV